MSTNAYQRASSRESKYWSPFNYSFMFTAPEVSDRIIIFGLYANALNNQIGYLMQVEETDLINIVNSYNEKISELDAQQVMVLNDIVTKQYMAAIEKQVHDNKLVTMQANINSDALEWDAKIAALSVDQAALTTQAAHVASETLKTDARIQELEALIAAEVYNASEVDIEIAQKQLQSAKIDVEILNAANEILKYQLDIVNAAIELIGVQESAANIKVRILEMERAIARTTIIQGDLTVEQKRTEVSASEKEVAIKRTEVAILKLGEPDHDLAYYRAMEAHDTSITTARTLELTTEDTNRRNAIQDRENVAAFNNQTREDAVVLENTTAIAQRATQVSSDLDRQNVTFAGNQATLTVSNADIAAAHTMATASITTTLTHTIQKKG